MTDALEHRAGLSDALRVLLAAYPRDIWTSHRNFDGLTRFWLERHLGFRQILAALQADSRGYLDGDVAPRQAAQRLARLGGALIDQLHGHHQIEDHHYFPLLSAAEPRLVGGFELLDRDHQALDGHLHALTDAANAALRALAAAESGAADRALSITQIGALAGRLDGFERFLDRHLTDEEDLVVPVILHHAPRW